MPQQIDYAALADQARRGSSVDYGALAEQARQGSTGAKPASPHTRSWLDSASDYFGEIHSLNPKDVGKSLWSVVSDLPGVVHGVLEAQGEVGHKAADAFKRGDYVEGVRHALNYAIPILGPRMDQSADLLQAGETAKGLGALTDAAVQVAAPKLIEKIPLPSKVGGVVKSSLNPDEAAAIKFLQERGIKVDAGTATGNKFVKAIQAGADHTPLGSVVESSARKANTRGLATLGEQLAAKANKGGAVTAEQAGEATQGALRDVVHGWNTEASSAYERLRAMEADPKHTTVIQPEVGVPAENAPWNFVDKPKPTSNEVFLSALEDARQQGYTGSAAELKGKFDDRVAQARSLRDAVAEGDEYGHAALLKEIRAQGGLRPFDKDFVPGAPTQKLRGDFQASQQANAKYYGKNAIYRTDGLETSDMLQRLSEDPKWGTVITPDTDLTELIHRGGLQKTELPPGDLQHHLRGVGVQPGVQWWNENAPAQSVPMAVDFRPLKAALQDTHEGMKLEARVAPLMGDKATAARAVERIMSAPDWVPLSAADAALGELKTFTRADNPDMRSVGQGKALPIVNQLHAAVQKAAEAAGPDAVRALEEGRQATTAKYLAAKVLERVEGQSGEPAGAFTRMTARGDSAIKHLRQVAAQAPEVIPTVARAVLDGILKEGTEGGGFDKAGTLWNKWNDLGPETRALLFKNPSYVQDLNNFFLGAKKLAEAPNPSGSATTGTAVASGIGVMTTPLETIPALFGAGAISKLLHSPAGVKLLTEGYRLPPHAGMVAKWTARVKAALENAPRVTALTAPAVVGQRQ